MGLLQPPQTLAPWPPPTCSAEHLWGHVGHGARRLVRHNALAPAVGPNRQQQGKAKVRELGGEAPEVARAAREQHVAGLDVCRAEGARRGGCRVRGRDRGRVGVRVRERIGVWGRNVTGMQLSWLLLWHGMARHGTAQHGTGQHRAWAVFTNAGTVQERRFVRCLACRSLGSFAELVWAAS